MQARVLNQQLADRREQIGFMTFIFGRRYLLLNVDGSILTERDQSELNEVFEHMKHLD